MFRRRTLSKLPSPSKESHPDTPTNNNATNTETTPLSPVPVPVTPIQSQQPQTISWASSTASGHSGPSVYDINSKYTTANSSYTHRRRKSSYIPGLNFGMRSEDHTYQPRYQDWRADMPVDQQQQQDLGNRLGGSEKEHTGDFRATKRQRVRRCAAVLVVIVLSFSGIWIFGGPLPLLKTSFGFNDGLGSAGSGLAEIVPDLTTLANLHADWQNLNISEWRMPYTVAHARQSVTSANDRVGVLIKSIWIAVRTTFDRNAGGRGGMQASVIHFATVSTTSTLTTTMTEHIDIENLIWATPATVSKVMVRATVIPREGNDMVDVGGRQKTVGPAVQRQEQVEDTSDNGSDATIVGPPLKAASADVPVDISADTRITHEAEIVETRHDDVGMIQEEDANAHSAYVEQLYRKHATRII